MSDGVLRADAERNRQRILVEAEKAFLERGATVPLEEVAKRAKVGIGTLYRRFPTREALLAATSEQRFLALAEMSRGKEAELGLGEALRQFLQEFAKIVSFYRSLAASLGTVIQYGTPGCIAITTEGARLLRCAQDAGIVRTDVGFDDIVCLVSAIAIAVEKESAPTARIAHLVNLLLNGMHVR